VLISLKWLNDYIDLSDVSINKIEEKLTASGLEVEEIIDYKSKFNNIVVGFVESSEKHPDSDHLSICSVSDGNSIFNVICGASNVAKGQKVAFAKVGAIVPNGNFEIKKAKIRGVNSEGMLCSESELGLSENHSGIIIFDESAEIGKNIASHLQLDDVSFEISITPNRADALSHIGVARDLAALFNKNIKLPEINYQPITKNITDFAKVIIENSSDCPRYSAILMKDVKIQESPKWLKDRLKTIGLRSINNIVDVTNYVMYEIGQPLHAFDLDNLSQRTIIIKNASENETFITLDSKSHKLKSNNLMIYDAEKPVAIAGIMGGENSEVTPNTKNILIESAFFNQSSIRKTAKQLGISTDASYRFERKTNPEVTIWAAKRAAQLIQQIAGGSILDGFLDVYPNPIEEKIVEVRFARIYKILGYSIEKNTIKDIFLKLGFVFLSDNNDFLKIKIPLSRPDIEREIDLIEEVARIYGFENIPEIVRINVTLNKKVDQTSLREKVRDIFVGLDLNEIITNSLLNKETAEKLGNPINLLNPQSSEMTHARPTLFAGMLQTISRNLKVKENNLKLYEIGHVFNQIKPEIVNFTDFQEIDSVLFAITGFSANGEWYQSKEKFDIYSLKGIAESLVQNIIPNKKIRFEYFTEANYHFEYGFILKIEQKEIGKGGKVKSDICKFFDVKQDVFAFETSINNLEMEAEERKFKTLLKFPKIQKDMAFIIEKSVTSEEVEKVIKKGSSNLLKNIKLFDIFEGEAIGKNMKSLAFQLDYYNEQRTLTEEEVDKEFWQAIEKVKTELKAELRGN